MSGWSSQVVIASQVIIEGIADGLFVYNGAPTAGNLIASIAAQSGTDPYDNPYPVGFNSQQGALANDLFANLVNGALFLGALTTGGVQDITHAAKVFSVTNPASAGLSTGKDPVNINQCILLLQSGTDTAGGGPQMILGDGDNTANVIAKLLGNLLIEPLETGQVLLYGNAGSAQSVDLVQFQVNSVDKFVVDKSGNLATVGTITQLKTSQVRNDANATWTGTGYGAASTALSTTAVLPASGRAAVRFTVREMTSTAGDNVLSDVTISGSTSGTLHAANDTSAIITNLATGNGPFVNEYVVAGVAGETLTATAQHRVAVNGTTGTSLSRAITIQTLPD